MSYGYLPVAPPSTTSTWPVRARLLTRKTRRSRRRQAWSPPEWYLGADVLERIGVEDFRNSGSENETGSNRVDADIVGS